MSEPERVPKQDGVAGVVFEAPFKIMKVCAFFRDTLFSDATWQVFGKYTPAAEGEQVVSYDGRLAVCAGSGQQWRASGSSLMTTGSQCAGHGQ